jgi:hypothetical protein
MDTTYYAARTGNLECLKYLHESGCPWHPGTTVEIAAKGNLNCLKYAYENGCPWDSFTTSQATRNGHLECLMYAHQNGCPWHPMTTWIAANNGHLNCLKYIYFNCQSIISPKDNELILPHVNYWKILVDSALDDKLVPSDIKNIIYTFW